PRTDQERRFRCALREHGPLVHGRRRGHFYWHGVPGHGFQKHHGLRAGAVQLFHRAALGTVLLGMLWKRASSAGGFWGLLAGTASSVGMWAWVKMDPSALRYVALSPYARDMAENMYRALWSCLICAFVTVAVSLATRPKPDAELTGLVYGLTAIPH